MSSRYIRFAYTVEDQSNIKRQSAAMSSFPHVIAAIDCTHVAVNAPFKNGFAYVNRNSFSNVLIICGVNMVLINVVACWPGSTRFHYTNVQQCRRKDYRQALWVMADFLVS